MLILLWNDWNRDHIAKHGVTPREAEYVVRHARKPFPVTREGGKRLVWGRTDAGRYLQVIFIEPEDEDVDLDLMTEAELMAFSDGDGDVAYVIHAMELTGRMKRTHRKGAQP